MLSGRSGFDEPSEVFGTKREQAVLLLLEPPNNGTLSKIMNFYRVWNRNEHEVIRMNPVSNRYEPKQLLGPLHDGQLYEGKDLSLQRTVFIYTLKLQGEAPVRDYIRKLGGAARQGATDSPFLHVLDIEIGSDTIHVIISYKPGCTLRDFIADRPPSFETAIGMVADLGQALLDAAGELSLDFSLEANNLWVTADGTINIVDTWDNQKSGPRLSRELCSLLTRLLARSETAPADADEVAALLRGTANELSPARKQEWIGVMKDAWNEKLTLASFVQYTRSLLRVMPEVKPPLAVEERRPAAFAHAAATSAAPLESRNAPVGKAGWRTGKKLALGLTFSALGVAVFAGVFVLLVETLNRDPKNPPPTHTTPIVAEQTPQTQTPPPATSAPDPKNEVKTVSSSADNPIIGVPSLTGLTLEAAEQTVLDSGLHYSFRREFDNQPAGTVFKQEPRPNEQVEKGSSVTFWVSKGPVQ